MQQKVVYISTWGNPSSWDEAIYVKEKEDKTESSDIKVKSFTSLATYDKYDKLILIVQDSILAPQGWNGTEYRNKDVDACIKQLNNNGQLIEKILNLQKYEDYLKVVNEYVSCLIRRTIKNEEDSKKVKVIIVPGIGKFSGCLMGTKVTCDCGLEGNKKKYISLLYIESLLAYDIYNEINDLNKGDTVILDITHGINYLPSLTLEVVKELASLLNLEMKVIEYIPTDRTQRPYNIYTYKEFTPLSNTKFDITKIRVGSITNNHVKALILSLQMGAILPILYICKKFKGGGTKYDEIFKNETQILNNSQNNNLNINFSIIANPNSILNNSDIVWGDIIFDYVCKKVMNIKEDQDSFYSLDDIRSIVNSLSNFFSETTIITILSELWKIEKLELKEGEEKMYFDAYQEKRTKGSAKRKEKPRCIPDSDRINAERSKENEEIENHPNRRNFIAHAGFLKEIVKVKKQNGKLFVKYSLEEGEKCYQVLKDIYGPDIGQLLIDLINSNKQTQPQGINSSPQPK